MAILGLGAAFLLTKNKIQVITLITLFFLITNATSYYGAYYNTKMWENHPQIKVSKWINSNIPQDKIIVIDQEGCKPGDVKKDFMKLCHEEGHTSLIGTWIKNPIRISKNEYAGDYFVSTRTLNITSVKEESGISVYAAH